MATLCAVIAVAAGCAIGPDPGPGLVLRDDGGNDGVSAAPHTSSVPQLDPPTSRLDWRDCTAELRSTYPFARTPGVELGCASILAPALPDRSAVDRVRVGLVRAAVSSTPADAAPIVLTSGTDMASSATLMSFVGGSGKRLLGEHPVIAIDRRGIGGSDALDCLTRTQRTALWTDALNPPGEVGASAARQDSLSTRAASAFSTCSDQISPLQLAYTAENAATDIEVLRTRLGMNRIGLLSIGEGSDVALAYAANHRTHLGRLVLDTPVPYAATAADATTARVTGVDAALRAFSDQCRAVTCSLGSDPAAAIAALIGRAGTGGLGSLSDIDVLTAITTAIATGPTQRTDLITAVSTMISQAASGSTGALAAAVVTGRELRATDGQQVSTCNDASSPPGRNEAATLIASLTGQYRMAGISAMSLLRCSGWPAAPKPPAPTGFDVPVVVLNGAGDPINGNGGVSSVAATITNASGTLAVIGWNGPAYGVSTRSDCAVDSVGQYLSSGRAPTTTDCPS
ncbi:alpha/beta hydrolase [Gordonia jinhuaensis]|uniref:Peptidase S33 tripeptidyl aminopeptidase-like C-terminal domain-containing protein n=1 Tax=Gordonia jinhuaensis TaxID=1517702 RepID=A0A916T0J1_9ACTN|nr:hypothetical protein GCM10011489_12160 [Gordonia jinhuaensis]